MMADTDLAVLVQKLEKQECSLLLEWNGREFVATAFKEMRYDIIRVTAQSLEGALTILAKAVAKAEEVGVSGIAAALLASEETAAYTTVEEVSL